MIIIHSSYKVPRKRIKEKNNKEHKGVENKGCGPSAPRETSDPSASEKAPLFLTGMPSFIRMHQEDCRTCPCRAVEEQFLSIHPPGKVFRHPAACHFCSTERSTPKLINLELVTRAGSCQRLSLTHCCSYKGSQRHITKRCMNVSG